MSIRSCFQPRRASRWRRCTVRPARPTPGRVVERGWNGRFGGPLLAGAPVPGPECRPAPPSLLFITRSYVLPRIPAVRDTQCSCRRVSGGRDIPCILSLGRARGFRRPRRRARHSRSRCIADERVRCRRARIALTVEPIPLVRRVAFRPATGSGRFHEVEYDRTPSGEASSDSQSSLW